MNRPFKLTDTQLLFLSTASQRDDQLLVPLANLKDRAASTAIAKLRHHALIEEIGVGHNDLHWREEYGQYVGLRLTAKGLEILGIAPEGEPSATPSPDTASVLEEAPGSSRTPTSARPGSKQARLLSLLNRESGATLLDLTTATGWLPHTTRAALTRLRQSGTPLIRENLEGASVYRIASAE